ncbi:MAG: hypothetical protein QXW98_05170 [Candidatus Caldarchaeum sp.]
MKVLLSVMKDGKKYWADSKETKQAHLYFAYPKSGYASIGFRTGQHSQVYLSMSSFKFNRGLLWNSIEALSTKVEG